MFRCRMLFVARGLLLFALLLPLAAQDVGDRVRLESSNSQGVPVHPQAGDPSFVRWANGTVGTVMAIDQATGWRRVDSENRSGWILKRYLTVVADPDDTDQPGPEIPTYVVGTWNLEHFHDGVTRGFPENGSGGPTYPSRSAADFQRIADTIKTSLAAKILILNEINGKPGMTRSDEMDRLVASLGGTSWAYELTAAGDAMRIAILYDTSAVRKDNCVELTVPAQNINGKDVFERDPLACKFTFLDSTGAAKNDLIVIGLHLASGQQLVNNHNTAMTILLTKLHQAMQSGTFPTGEKDVLIGGDLNASRYDNKVENFWENYDTGQLGFITLSPTDGAEYHPTRMAGVPLAPRSQIDYLLASGLTGGLTEKLVQLTAQVHSELLAGGFDDFRAHASDHIPVTVRIRVVPDND